MESGPSPGKWLWQQSPAIRAEIHALLKWDHAHRLMKSTHSPDVWSSRIGSDFWRKGQSRVTSDKRCGTSRTFDSFGSHNFRKKEKHVIQFWPKRQAFLTQKTDPCRRTVVFFIEYSQQRINSESSKMMTATLQVARLSNIMINAPTHCSPSWQAD